MLFVEGITDLPDGFQLEPKPRPVGLIRGLAIGLATSIVLILVLFVSLAVTYGKPIYLLAGAVFMALAAGSDLLLWRVLQPPVLKADSTSVVYKSGFQSVSVPRSELTLIFKGQVVQRALHGLGPELRVRRQRRQGHVCSAGALVSLRGRRRLRGTAGSAGSGRLHPARHRRHQRECDVGIT